MGIQLVGSGGPRKFHFLVIAWLQRKYTPGWGIVKLSVLGVIWAFFGGGLAAEHAELAEKSRKTCISAYSALSAVNYPRVWPSQ